MVHSSFYLITSFSEEMVSDIPMKNSYARRVMEVDMMVWNEAGV